MDRERRRPRDRAAVAVDVAPARAVPRRRAARRAAAGGRARAVGRALRRAPGHRRPARRLLGVRGPVPVAEAGGRGGGPRARRHDDDRHHLRRRATRLLRPGRARCTTWTRTGRRRRSASPTSRGSAARPSSRPRTASSRCSACARTTTGWSRSGARRAAAGSCRCASSRSGTRSSPRPRSSATRRVACAPSCFSEIPAYLGLPSIHSGDWDPFFAACEATGTVLCLHIGSGTKMPSTSPDAPLGVTVTIGFGNCMNSLADWLFSGKLAQFPGLAPVVRGEPDRLDPVPARAGRRRVEAAPRVGLDRRRDQRAAVDLLLPPGVRLLLPRPPRRGLDSTRAASTT